MSIDSGRGRATRSLVLFLLALPLGSCGGKVIVDAPGEEGGCEALLAAFEEAFREAIRCRTPDLPDACEAVARDSCGCEVPAGDRAAGEQSTSAFLAANEPGCFPPCGVPCTPSPGGFCTSDGADGFICQPQR